MYVYAREQFLNKCIRGGRNPAGEALEAEGQNVTCLNLYIYIYIYKTNKCNGTTLTLVNNQLDLRPSQICIPDVPDVDAAAACPDVLYI